ncbi:MAG TPA: patatin-like phospholipase family protein [Ramlibacter sp.]|uniref:patatin-like phospholipase family protein n=1 Tax=Ramlibacter sp. TaxID=1917967 RepID=UPI002ED095F4
MRTASRKAPRIALALAGGGPLAASYEIGALCALDEALDGLDLTGAQHYVGVSAGGFIAAALANGMRPRELCAAFIGNRGADAWPAGPFSGEAIHRRLAEAFSRPGRSNDFRALRARLSVVATDLDTGRAVAFGTPGRDAVPISRAVQASCALPGLFPPVRIDGRTFVDGALAKTMHASVALEQGVDLMLCINPLVPFATRDLASGGLPAVLGQGLRTVIHSRLALAMKHYASAYPNTDIVLLEPDPADAELRQAGIFGYGQRKRIAGHAYRATLDWLRSEERSLAPRFARHGIALRSEVLHDPHRALVPAAPPRRLAHALARLHTVLDDLEATLQPA